MVRRSRLLEVVRNWRHPTHRGVRQRWYQSLQFRTVISTVVLTTLILVLTFFGLSLQISQRILDSKVAGAERDLTTARLIVEAQLNDSDHTLTDETRMANALVSLTARAPKADQLAANAGSFIPVLYLQPTGLHPAISTSASLHIPPALVSFVSSNQVSYQYSHMDLGSGGSKVLIVGTPTNVDMPDLQLYLIYSLAGEERTLNLFNTTFFSGGLLIVVLMGAASYLISRQIVRPVRQAANAAQHFASGDLDARMEVRGQDDFARLATAFNEMAGALQEQIVQLEEFGSAQKRFTADVSHELRTPLTTVRMAADVIHEHTDGLPPGVVRASQLMMNELDRFQSLVDDLMEISRHDTGEEELVSACVDIRTCVYAAVSAVSGASASVAVSAEIDMPDTPVMCEVDSRRVERILRNLLSNAYDHCEGKPVILTLRADENTVGISVRDHGVGLKPGEAKLVFNRLWRGDDSRNRQFGGAGLGLAIATQDAKLHGGRLEAWGMPGEGACFRLTLPRTPGEKVTSSPVPLRFSVGDETTEQATPTGELPLGNYLPPTDTPTAAIAAASSTADATTAVAPVSVSVAAPATSTSASPSGELPVLDPPLPETTERPLSGETELVTVMSEEPTTGTVSGPMEGLAEVPASIAAATSSAPDATAPATSTDSAATSSTEDSAAPAPRHLDSVEDTD